MSSVACRRATVADIPAMSRIRLAVTENVCRTRHTRADRFYAAQGWTREDMKDDIEVWYRLRRADAGAHKTP